MSRRGEPDLRCDDWRDAGVADLAGMYDAERWRWCATLAWDPAPRLAALERARSLGELPGLVLRHAGTGASIGWTCYTLEDGVLRLLMLAAPSAAGIRRLLEGVLASPEAHLARRLSAFLYPISSSTGTALGRLRFRIATHTYALGPIRSAAEQVPAGVQLRPWRTRDDAAAVRLLAGAVDDPRTLPPRRLDERARRFGRLLRTPEHGIFLPLATLLAQAGDEVIGLVVVTAVGPGTVHIAQLEVRQDWRESGLAHALAAAGCRAAAALGAGRVSMLLPPEDRLGSEVARRLALCPAGEFLAGQRGPVPRQFRTTTGSPGRPVAAPKPELALPAADDLGQRPANASGERRAGREVLCLAPEDDRRGQPFQRLGE